MFPNPLFVIAFVTIRFSFLSGQSYSKFRFVESSSVKVFPQISLKILKIVVQSCQTEKSNRVCRTELSSQEFAEPVERKSENCLGKDSALSNSGFSQEKFSMNGKSRNILFVCRLPWFFKLNGNGWRYGKCGIRLLLNCLPAQMYRKISNVSTNTQTRICYSVC